MKGWLCPNICLVVGRFTDFRLFPVQREGLSAGVGTDLVVWKATETLCLQFKIKDIYSLTNKPGTVVQRLRSKLVIGRYPFRKQAGYQLPFMFYSSLGECPDRSTIPTRIAPFLTFSCTNRLPISFHHVTYNRISQFFHWRNTK